LKMKKELKWIIIACIAAAVVFLIYQFVNFLIFRSTLIIESPAENFICVNLCTAALEKGENLSAGPCLANPINNTDYVCDVAHSPRQKTDNLPENQCSAYREGKAHHFVEVTPECEVIKSV
jgi:hypothetical protein